jgi:DNA-directed RNA polymerase subunit omega
MGATLPPRRVRSSTRTFSTLLRTEGTAIARIDDLMDKVDSRFHLVHLSAKRAREINGYFAQLGEGMGAFVPPLLTTETNKPLSIALEEIAQGKIEVAVPSEPAPAYEPADEPA